MTMASCVTASPSRKLACASGSSKRRLRITCGEPCATSMGRSGGAVSHMRRSPLHSPAMKIYTRTGDDGTTGLLGRARVPKHDARVEAYGSVDELNAVLGMAHALDHEHWFGELVPGLQSALFQVGAELATTDAAMLAKLAR